MEDLNAISRAAESSASLTSQLLGFARKQPFAPRPIDLNEAISGILGMLRRLVGEAVAIQWQPGRELWSVSIDPAQLDQVLTNLCANARDAITDTGIITIETRNTALDDPTCGLIPDSCAGEYVVVVVKDSGVGMDEDTLQHAFDPFFTTKEMGKGTGLGLSSVYGIMQQNGGFSQIISKPKQGTAFHLYFPRCHDQPKKEFATQLVERGHETVLLVEDDETILLLGKKMLEDIGYQVLAAGNARDALTVATTFRGEIDLLITDVIMPDMNGNDLALAITASRPSISCLFMSGYTAEFMDSKLWAGRSKHLLQKPFSKEAFAQKVREVLAGRNVIS